MTPAFRRTARTRRVSSASTRERWASGVTVRSGCRCTRSGRGERCRWGGRCICRRTGARTSSGDARRRSPTRSSSRPSRSLGSSWSSAPRAGMFRGRRCSAITPMAENTWLRDRLDQAECEYVLSLGPTTKVFEQGTVFAVPAQESRGRLARPVRPRPDRKPEPIGELIERLRADGAQSVTFRDGPDGEPVTSTFIFARVHAAHGWRDDQRRQRVAHGRRGAPARGMADHRMARRTRASRPTTGSRTCPPTPSPNSSPGSHACAGRWSSTTSSSKASSGSTTTKAAPGSAGITTPRLVTAAHGFLTLERLNPFHPRPA